jgi:hypothetical protein
MPMGDRTGPRGEGPMTGRGAGYCAKNKTQKDGPGRKLGPRRGKRRLGRGLGLRYLDDPTFTIALKKRLTARGIPTEEVNNAILYCKEIIETIQKEDFQEKQSGWHPNIDEIADMTRNAENRTPKKEAPYTGGGPAPARNEIS